EKEKKPEEKATAKKPEEKPKKPVIVKVDSDGIQNRILGLEITPGNYRNIRMLDDGRIFYLRRTAADDVGEDDEEGFPDRDKKSHLCVYNVDDRNDLTYLLGELIAELNNGHTYVAGGERPDTPRIKLGLLGAEFSRDPATRAYRIERILPGENWDKKTRSPLTDVGVNVKPGDYILAINNTPVSTLPNLYDALIGTADKQVILRVNSKPTDAGARDVTVVPTDNEA